MFVLHKTLGALRSSAQGPLLLMKSGKSSKIIKQKHNNCRKKMTTQAVKAAKNSQHLSSNYCEIDVEAKRKTNATQKQENAK